MQQYILTDLDNTMIELFGRGSTHRIGLPTDIVEHVLKREDYPHSANSILGVKEEGVDELENPPIDLLADYKGMVGYQFSWGSVSECYVPADGVDFEEEGIFFEVLPEVLLAAHPYPCFWEDLMIALYEDHPESSEEFGADDAAGSFHTMMFSAWGADQIARLRAFMAETFLPTILPDILQRGLRLMEETANDPSARATAAARHMVGVDLPTKRGTQLTHRALRLMSQMK